MSDWRSKRQQQVLVRQEEIRERSLLSLSSGSLASMVEESRRIPIISLWIEGEKVLPGARGISRSVNRIRRLQSAVLHWEQGGGSAIKKSSRMCRTPLMFSLL